MICSGTLLTGSVVITLRKAGDLHQRKTENTAREWGSLFQRLGCKCWEYRRGFVEGVGMPASAFLSQAGTLFRLMSKDEKLRLYANTARAMAGVTEEIKLRWVRLCAKADPEYGSGLAKQLGIEQSKAMAA